MKARLGARVFTDHERTAIALAGGRDGKATRREIRAFAAAALELELERATRILEAVTQPLLPLDAEATP